MTMQKPRFKEYPRKGKKWVLVRLLNSEGMELLGYEVGDVISNINTQMNILNSALHRDNFIKESVDGGFSFRLRIEGLEITCPYAFERPADRNAAVREIRKMALAYHMRGAANCDN